MKNVLVADANVVIAALVAGVAGREARARLSDGPVLAPELLDVEVLSVLRRLVTTRELSRERAAVAVTELALLPIERYRHRTLLPMIWELRENASAYDAAYVALARATDSVFLSADARLVQAAGRWCSVELFGH
ncbi:type II toxin-antitoxin system VapC family toxin [Aeromicrobium sp. CTD01-1L150]|uniref:type II toxin-antitoxin system VapC family toxin n=1 Tax=Aeromicrobium sp. CTD01-1L150 TaxID=3341830 RepID=UPI0035C03A98